jgi:hypothetical protein
VRGGLTFESIQCTALPLTQMGIVSRMSGVLCMPACLRCTWQKSVISDYVIMNTLFQFKSAGELANIDGGLDVYAATCAPRAYNRMQADTGSPPHRKKHRHRYRSPGHTRAATAPRNAVCHLHDLLYTGPAIRINLQAFDYVASETRFAHEVRPPQHGGDLGHASQREAGVENNGLFG